MSSSDGASDAACATTYATTSARIGPGTPSQDRVSRNREPAWPALDSSIPIPAPRDSDRPKSDTFIQAAHSIAPQIDGDVLIANGGQFPHDAIANFRLERTRELVAPDFQSSERR